MLAPNELNIFLVICCMEGRNWWVMGNLQPQEFNHIIQPPPDVYPSDTSNPERDMLMSRTA
jgi:hypothetical protein